MHHERALLEGGAPLGALCAPEREGGGKARRTAWKRAWFRGQLNFVTVSLQGREGSHVSESGQVLNLSLFSRDVSRGMKKSERGKEKGRKHGCVE